MIPLKLQLRNFMCYRDGVPPLSFEGIHLACLCGDNGAGKSALLDAITWALWGKSRAENDDALVHEGRAEMEIDFEFRAQGQTYRAVRKHMRGSASRSGTTLLTLLSSSNGAYNDISGNTKSETQQKIIGLLRLDYKTFRNSAYLVQGKANEFTVADPAERKKVLAAILDLSQYDELAELARAKASEKNSLALSLQDIIAHFDSELEGKARCQAELGELRIGREKVRSDLAAAETRLAGLLEEVRQAELKQSQATEAGRRASELKADAARWAARGQELLRQVSDFEDTVAERAAIESGHNGFLGLQAEDSQLAEKARQLLSLNSSISRLELSIERAQNTLVSEHRSVQTRLEEERQKAATLASLQASQSSTMQALASLSTLEDKTIEKRSRITSLIARSENLKAENARRSEEIRQIDGKLSLLASRGARCPLCDSELGEGGTERVRNSYETERAEREHIMKGNAIELERITDERRALEMEASRSEASLKADRSAMLGKIGRLEAEIAAAQSASAALVEDEKRRAALEERLATRSYATSEQNALGDLRSQSSRLGYDEARHAEVKRLLGDAAKFQRKMLHLEEALQRLPRTREELSAVEATVAELNRKSSEEEERARLLVAQSSGLTSLLTRVDETRASLAGLGRSENEHNERIAVAQEQLRRCERMEQDRAARKAELSSATEEESYYRQLSEAFGKKGIQALLIEQNRREIEREADRLLKRLTDNRMSIAINMQKPTKKGTVVETLDILVGDEFGGTRSYEMFSGGEAFRIDFALRIALARLLTHRSGASLSTLFIDEGFGTQDASGRDRLVEVINSIQDEFEKIIVITHLEELKDAFPTRIEVSRTENGSVVSVS